jgi:hypothetical protein
MGVQYGAASAALWFRVPILPFAFVTHWSLTHLTQESCIPGDHPTATVSSVPSGLVPLGHEYKSACYYEYDLLLVQYCLC